MSRTGVLLPVALSLVLALPAAGQRAAEITEGMSQQEVLRRFGHPNSTRLAGNELRMFYMNRCRVPCADDVVVLRHDRVVSATLTSPLRSFSPAGDAAEPALAREATAPAFLAGSAASDPQREASSGGAAPTPAATPAEVVKPAPGRPARPSRSPSEADAATAADRGGDDAGARRMRSGPRRIGVHSSVTSVLESNLYRHEDPQPAQGIVAAAGFRVHSSSSRPSTQLAYEIAHHDYRQTEDWDRVSHNVRGTLGRRLRPDLSAEATAEAAIKGTSEDRDLGNLFSLSPRLEYRLTRANRLRLTGAYRLRQLEGEATPSETNRYLQLDFRQRLDIGQWQLSYRFEGNDSHSERRDYTRWTFGTGHTAQLGARNELDLGIRYRAQTYPARILTINNREAPRQDHRWIASLAWTHAARYGFSTLLEYRYESRASNDPGREYDAHTVTFGLRHDW
jgi:hypothetical protein